MVDSSMTEARQLDWMPGLKVGHAQDDDALTGCTVVLCEAGAVAGVSQRGGAPGTRETDLLNPLNLVEQVHAILLAGGSAFGLEAATGVVRYLEERGVGFDTGVARVPIVPAAILFDLGIGQHGVRPDAEMGYRACQAAGGGPVAEGNVGAGCGATVGKILGPERAMKSGLGSARLEVGGGLVVSALAAVNALGDVIDPSTGAIVAGARAPAESPELFANALKVMKAWGGGPFRSFLAGENTVIGIVATNARLTKVQATQMAQMAHDGLARAIRPAHTLFDGDTIFSLACGEIETDLNVVGAFAAEAFTQAILSAVRSCLPAGGLPAAADFARS